MFRIGVRCLENATLLGKPNYKCHMKSQPFEVAHDEAIITKWSTGKISHTAIPICDALSTIKSREGTSGGRFPG